MEFSLGVIQHTLSKKHFLCTCKLSIYPFSHLGDSSFALLVSDMPPVCVHFPYPFHTNLSVLWPPGPDWRLLLNCIHFWYLCVSFVVLQNGQTSKKPSNTQTEKIHCILSLKSPPVPTGLAQRPKNTFPANTYNAFPQLPFNNPISSFFTFGYF